MSTILTNHETHKIGCKYVSSKLVDLGIGATSSNDPGIDFILDDGRSILVRSISKDGRIPLTNGSLDHLKADILVIVTNLYDHKYRKFYSMPMEVAKTVCVNSAYKVDNRPNYFINRSSYTTDQKKPNKREMKSIEKQIKIEAKAADKVRERMTFRADYERRHNINPED